MVMELRIRDEPLTLTKPEAARRQVEGAIQALGVHFNIAITLAGAAEGMIDQPDNLFAYHRDHPRAKELGIQKQELLDHLNAERNWLKHKSGPESMTFTLYSAAFMIARAVTALDPEHCTVPIRAFWHWWTDNAETVH